MAAASYEEGNVGRAGAGERVGIFVGTLSQLGKGLAGCRACQDRAERCHSQSSWELCVGVRQALPAQTSQLPWQQMRFPNLSASITEKYGWKDAGWRRRGL